ncbi:hypothetical protein BD770DRAFT_382202 [Pilaira anomala]|nr:hypothetical protein BD770DRAFT_382202 [Pilaira anomala]
MSQPPPSFEEVEYKRKMGMELRPTIVSKALSNEIKDKQRFDHAEILFGYLLEILVERKKKYSNYNELDIVALQRAVGTLVRYAPTPDKARHYFHLTLKEIDKSLITINLELTIIINLIYVYSQHHLMKEALEIVKTAVEIGIYHVKVDHKYQPDKFKDPIPVFDTISAKILKHFNMELNEDKTEVRSCTKKY